MGKTKHEGKRAVARAKARQKRDLIKAGVKQKIDAVLFACSSPEFQRRFSAAAEREGDALSRMRDVDRIVRAVLDEMEVSNADVFLTFSWNPSERKLGVYFRPARPLTQVARAALAAVPAASTPSAP